MAEDSHRCRAGDRCVSHTSDGAALTPKPNTLCHGCIAKLQAQYDDFPAIRHALRLFVAKGLVAVGGAKVASTPEPPAPINLHCLDVIDEVDRIIDDIGNIPIADVARQQDGVARALAVGRAWRKADGIIGMSLPWRQRMAPCPECGLRQLGHYAGSDIVNCRGCGYVMTYDEYSRITLISVELEKLDKKGGPYES